jgi:hypothetical protein
VCRYFWYPQLNIIVKSSESKYEENEKELINLLFVATVVDVVVLTSGREVEDFWGNEVELTFFGTGIIGLRCVL